MSTLQNGTDIPVGPEDEVDLREPRPAAAAAAPSVEDQLLERLLDRLNRMGVASPGGPQPQPEHQWEEQHSQPSQRDQDARQEDQQWGQSWNALPADQQWGQSWDEWHAWPGTSSGWPSWHNWKTTGWNNNEDKFDRPYISHLDFPKFDGRREEYSNYQYAVMNLKSQCAPRDHKYLTPQVDFQPYWCYE